jgi:hypothetical protein
VRESYAVNLGTLLSFLRFSEGSSRFITTAENSPLLPRSTAYLQIGRVKEGLSIVENSLAEMTDDSEAYNTVPDLYRRKGELLLMLDSHELEAERCFYKAIAISGRHSDRAAELGATTSLARLLATEGRRDEARAALAEIYNWFTEGFDTADLKEAKALLDELSR